MWAFFVFEANCTLFVSLHHNLKILINEKAVFCLWSAVAVRL